MRRFQQVSMLAAALFCGRAIGLAQGGAVAGVAELNDGTPAVNAFVSLRGNPQAGVSGPAYNADVNADSQGNYQFSGVPDGPYRVCFQLAGGLYLDPCTWADTPPLATVLNGSSVQMPPVLMQLGAPVNAQFADPGGLLSASSGKNIGKALFVGVWKATDGIFIPMRALPGNSYLLYVRPSVPLTFSVTSNFTSLSADPAVQGAVHTSTSGVDSISVPISVPPAGLSSVLTINVAPPSAPAP